MTGSIRYKTWFNAEGMWEEVPHYYLDGEEVPEETYRAAFPEQPLYSDESAARQPSGRAGYPILSDAIGVHPDQIPEAREFYRKKGVSVDFHPDGRLIMESAAHRKRVLKARGVHDRNSYNGY